MKYTKWPQHIPNGLNNTAYGKEIDQNLPLQVPPQFTQIRIFVVKTFHLASLILHNTRTDKVSIVIFCIFDPLAPAQNKCVRGVEIFSLFSIQLWKE
jgi:hypothetical protein